MYKLLDKNTTLCCEFAVLQQCSRDCDKEWEDMFFKHIIAQLWRVDALLLVNAIFAGVIVGIGAYGHRYRHYGFTHYLLLVATTLFLPIISYVLSAIGSTGDWFTVSIEALNAQCMANILHPYLVMVSTSLVLISAINTSTVVATDDREDRSIHPPFELLLQGIWIVYLVVNTHVVVPSKSKAFLFDLMGKYYVPLDFLRFTPFALIHAKLALKYYAFLKARTSFALGRNPRLIVGYMKQLQEGSIQHGESPVTCEEDVNVPPPLVVIGENGRQVEKQPHGYMFRGNLEALQEGGMVTIDKVWQLDDTLLTQMTQLKDMCLSFALFKLLRCRFARYKLTDKVVCTEIVKFFRSVLLKEGEHDRAFRMIADELSFLHDYYDSPLPVSSSDSWLTICSMVISVLSIGYCILSGMDVIRMTYYLTRASQPFTMSTIRCVYYCRLTLLRSDYKIVSFGSLYFDLVPVMLLLLLVVVAEARDIAFHIFSGWTKVILTCRCAHRASLRLSPVVPRWVGFLLQARSNTLMRHWNEKMGQNSMLELHPRQLRRLVFPGWILPLLDWRRNYVEIPSAVKASIIDAVRRTSRSNGACLSKGATSLRQSKVGESLLWACKISEGTTDTILVWHIATAILEVRHPHDDPPRKTEHRGRQPFSISHKKTAATHLSRYCAYLVAFCPELLPDDDAWSKGLYKDVKMAAARALASGNVRVPSTPPETVYRRLIELLGARPNHEVLKDAAKLAEQLGKLKTGGDEMAWELLAGFWSEMVLYLAPSDNIKGHLRAIDQGGELITLLWAMLTHVGIVDRPDETASASSCLFKFVVSVLSSISLFSDFLSFHCSR